VWYTFIMLRQRGEISLLLSIVGIFVSLIGIGVGTALVNKTSVNTSSADSFPYKAVLEIRDENGVVLPWVEGMKWTNNFTTTKNLGNIKDPNQNLARLTWETGNMQEDIRNTLATVTISLPPGYTVVKPFCDSTPDRICALSTATENPLIRKNIELAKNGVVTYGVQVKKPHEAGQGNLEVQVTALNYPQKLKYFNDAHIASREPASCERVTSGQLRPLYLYNFTVVATCMSGDCPQGKTYEANAEKRRGYVTFSNLPTGKYTLELEDIEERGFKEWSGCVNKEFEVQNGTTNKSGVVILENFANGIYDDQSTEQWCKDQGGRANIVQDISNILCYYPEGKKTEPIAPPIPSPTNVVSRPTAMPPRPTAVRPSPTVKLPRPTSGPSCGQKCVYSEVQGGATKCFEGTCPVGARNCGFNTNCRYTPQCTPAKQVTCPGASPIPPPSAPLPGDKCKKLGGNGAYKIIFIPDDFANLADFETQAKAAVANIRSSGLKDIESKLTFLMHTNVKADYKCQPVTDEEEGHTWTSLSCTGAATPRSDCGGDPSTVVFIWNNSFDKFAQAGAGVAIVPVPRVTISTSHEMGHAVARLYDEYVYDDQFFWPDGQQPLTDRVNCAPSTDPTCKKWNAENNPELGCFKGCSHRDWYRPIDQFSLMNAANYRMGTGAVWNTMQLNEWRNRLALAGVRSFSDINIPTYHTSTRVVLKQIAVNVLTLDSVENTASYPITTTDLLSDTYYTFSILDAQGNILFQRKEDKEIIYLEDGQRSHGLQSEIELYLPYFENGKSIQVTNEVGDAVLDIPLEAYDLRIVDNNQNLCGNAVCDAAIGENSNSCAVDCGAPAVEKSELQKADFDGDGAITTIDLATLIDAYGTPGADINGDGSTNAIDYTIIVKWYGVTL